MRERIWWIPGLQLRLHAPHRLHIDPRECQYRDIQQLLVHKHLLELYLLYNKKERKKKKVIKVCEKC